MSINFFARRNSLVIGLLLIFILSSLLTGCGPSKKEIATQYTESVKPIMTDVQQESQKWDNLRQKSAKGQISNSQFATTVRNELLPNMIKLQERMEKVAPEKEMREIHEIGIKMINKNVQAYTDIIAAVASNDMSKITSANSLLAEARELERKYVNQIQDMQK